MQVYIALLRGINVGGHKILNMEKLRQSLESLELTNISTYIQSGNIIFKSDISDVALLEKKIADKIEEHFNFIVPVTILTPQDLNKVIEENPFSSESIDDPAQPYVAFLSTVPAPNNLESLIDSDYGNDRFININKTLYLFYSNSAANTKLTNSEIEKKLKLTATTRNWKTVNKLLEMSTQLL